MKADEERDLTPVLRQWRAPEPAPDFEKAVWARIGKERQAGRSFGLLLPWQTAHWPPLAALAASFALAVGVGVGAGMMQNGHGTPPETRSRYDLNAPGTVTGDYEQLIGRDLM
jgi:hypothetical protein